MTRRGLLGGLLALALAGCDGVPGRGEPGSPRRKALDTLDRQMDRTDVHCVGRRRIRCHTHVDGEPTSARRWRRR